MMYAIFKSIVSLGLLLLVSTVSAQTITPERVIYRGDPLPISLSIGHERRITFDHPIYVDVPESLATLSTQIVGPDLYWKASSPFDSVRIVVGEEGGNRIYLINLNAVQQDYAAPQLLVSDNRAVKSDDNKSMEQEVATVSDNLYPKIGFGGLFRYSAKQLYAPHRLREAGQHNNLTNAPIPEGRIHHLIRKHKVITEPIKAWQNDTHYVTALLVTNTTDRPITLDPREIRGEVLAARFQRNHLEPLGSMGDATTLFLISKRPLAESINGHAVRIDSRSIDRDHQED
ncbi:integrating conjugative element protein [Candidatus Thiodiazotropha endoloripes]|nr:integrating conjugative element protein [Candidatus Thiodiazotropha endoloripes]